MAGAQQWQTGVWHGDEPLTLPLPREWDVAFLWPKTPPPLSDDQIKEILESPQGQPPIRQICRGKSKPLVIVDDPNRPTPVARLLPFLLAHFRDAGIPASSVRILVATGTHGAPLSETLLKKIGAEASSACHVLVHDAKQNLVYAGRTSLGTPVLVNREVRQSDFLVGIGGVYPSHTAGFGGGSKLVLGVLGFPSIEHLHYRHQALGWSSTQKQSSFRQDLDEIARLIGLNAMISLQVNAERQIVHMSCGDHFLYYPGAVAFAKQAFAAPLPEGADVVICNAYPNDLSLTFARMKGTAPLDHCVSAVSRIVVASCSEGVGFHGLFPLVDRGRFYRQRQIARRLRRMKLGDVARKIGHRIYRGLRSRRRNNSASENPIWLYRPGIHREPLPSRVEDMRITSSWQEILQAVREEQAGKDRLKVLVYPCAPLQCLERQETRAPGEAPALAEQAS